MERTAGSEPTAYPGKELSHPQKLMVFQLSHFYRQFFGAENSKSGSEWEPGFSLSSVVS